VRRTPTPDELALGASFQSTADSWDTRFESATTRGHVWRARLSTVVRLIGDGPGDVLDAGMGPGRLLAELERRNWAVAGVDAAPRMVELARGRLPGSSARLAVARVEHLPFPDASFDAAVCTGVLGYAHLDVGLLELARVLRPGGRLVVSFGRGRTPYRMWQEAVVDPSMRVIKRLAPVGGPIPPHRRTATAQELETFLQAAGLEVEALEYAGAALLLDPLDALLPRLAVRLCEFAERRPSLRRVFALQLVALARKPVQEADTSSR
jgi:ubiquinone/menaquinone biosynthesis C-methylase UbiE